jgi:hypothetical protein
VTFQGQEQKVWEILYLPQFCKPETALSK